MRYSPFLLLTVFLLPSAFATDLQDAINIARINNRNIKLENIKLKSTKTLKTEAIGEFLPNVSASMQYGNRNSAFKNQTTDPSTKQKYQEIKVQQPLFDGFHSVLKYKEANYKIKSASSKVDDKNQEISFIAVESYCNLYRYQELLRLYKANRDYFKKFIDLVQRRKDVKIIDNSDIIKFNYEAAAGEEKYLEALNSYNKAKFEYKTNIGELHENIVKPKAEIEEFDRNFIVENALKNNHSLNSAHYQYLASKAAYNAEKSNFSPKVSLELSANRQDNVVYLNNADLTTKTVFVNVSVPLFQKGIEYSSLSRAKYDRDAALEEYEINKDNVAKEVNKALEEYRFFQDLNKTNKRLFELSQKRNEIFAKRLNAKVEDPIEVLRVKIESNQRLIDYINSQMDLVIIYYKIKYFMGEI